MTIAESDVNIYERHSFHCNCGHFHEMPIGKVLIQKDAANTLPENVQELGLGKKGILVTDRVIYDAFGKEIFKAWKDKGLQIELLILEGRLKPDESAVGAVICNIPFDVEYIVSLGGGTITDVVRYAATRLQLKCVSIPSAMTMDGFFTNMSIIVVNGLQVTYYLNYPDLILADSDIISKAPSFMNAAGIGEVVSKISAGIDWYASNLIKDTYYCDNVASMMQACILEGTEKKTISGIKIGNKDAAEGLTDALYKSAVAMAWYGASPCGSGAEHQLNHFWIKCQDEKGIPQSMHGHEVGVGAVVNLMVWEEIMKMDFERFDIEKAVAKMWTKEEWEEKIRETFGNGAKNILKTQENNHFFDPEVRRKEIEQILKVIPKLKEKMKKIPSSKQLINILKTVGAPYKPEQLQIDRDDLIKSLFYAKETRSGRYNALWIIESLGVMEKISLEIVDSIS